VQASGSPTPLEARKHGFCFAMPHNARNSMHRVNKQVKRRWRRSNERNIYSKGPKIIAHLYCIIGNVQQQK